jgi:hypothetical protein
VVKSGTISLGKVAISRDNDLDGTVDYVEAELDHPGEVDYRRETEDGEVGPIEVIYALATAPTAAALAKGHDPGWAVMAFDLVGRTGFEPVTSSVSGKRAPAAPTARDVR